MKKFFAIFTRNWSLKLLALILALVVFYVVRASIRSPHAMSYETPSFMKGPH